MARPATFDCDMGKRINIAIDEDTKKKFKFLCFIKGKSMTDVVRDFVVKEIKSNEKQLRDIIQ